MNERIIEKLIDKGIRVLNNFNRNEAIEFFILNIFIYNEIKNSYPELYYKYSKVILIEKQIMEYFRFCNLSIF